MENKDYVSIIVKDINSDEYIYKLNNSMEMFSASLIKVPIMLAILNEVKNDNINLYDTIIVKDTDILDDSEVFEDGENYYTLYELLNWMIIKSDNTATNVLIKRFGMDNINDYIVNVLNVKNTFLERYMLDDNATKKGLNNYTSQDDMLKIFTDIFNKTILNEELCNIAISILKNQRCQDKIMRYIYDPVKFAHITGSINNIVHDVGVMKINDRSYYIGISVCSSKSNKQIIGKLGKVIYERLYDIEEIK